MADTTDGKFKSRLGSTLTRAGAFLGGLGALAYLIKLKIELSPQMQQVLFYKGLFAATAVLLILGAWWGRAGRRELEAAKEKELISPSGNQLDLEVGSRKRDALPEKR